jgi:phospholipid transport system substrate-binding protein
MRLRPQARSLLLLLCWLAVTPAYATEQEALQFVRSISNDAFTIMDSPALTDEIKKQKLTDLFITSVDTPWISKFVMGRHWKELTPQKQEEYKTLFQHFLINQYVPKFKQYNNHQYSITKVFSDKEEHYTIYSNVITQDNINISVNYKVHQNSAGHYQIYDVIAEGISLLNTHRSEFASVLSRDGVDTFITMLSQKVKLATY